MNKTKKQALILGVAVGAVLSFSTLRACEEEKKEMEMTTLASNQPRFSVLFKAEDNEKDFLDLVKKAKSAQKKPCKIGALKVVKGAVNVGSIGAPGTLLGIGANSVWKNISKNGFNAKAFANPWMIAGGVAALVSGSYHFCKCGLSRKGLNQKISAHNTTYETNKNHAKKNLEIAIRALKIPEELNKDASETIEAVQLLGNLRNDLKNHGGFGVENEVLTEKMEALGWQDPSSASAESSQNKKEDSREFV